MRILCFKKTNLGTCFNFGFAFFSGIIAELIDYLKIRTLADIKLSCTSNCEKKA